MALRNTTTQNNRTVRFQDSAASSVTDSRPLRRDESLLGAPLRRTILIIDDDAELRSLLTFVFTKKGYRVFEAEDGQEGLETALTRSFDLILVDFDLPFVHGLEVVRQLRQHPKFEALPIIMMTSHGNCVRESAVKAGCDQFLPKPLDFDQLYEMLEYFAPVNPPEEV